LQKKITFSKELAPEINFLCIFAFDFGEKSEAMDALAYYIALTEVA